jgi:hypothetical protein
MLTPPAESLQHARKGGFCRVDEPVALWQRKVVRPFLLRTAIRLTELLFLSLAGHGQYINSSRQQGFYRSCLTLWHYRKDNNIIYLLACICDWKGAQG